MVYLAGPHMTSLTTHVHAGGEREQFSVACRLREPWRELGFIAP